MGKRCSTEDRARRVLKQIEFCDKIKHIITNKYMTAIELASLFSVKGSTMTSWFYLGGRSKESNSAPTKGFPAFAIADTGMIYLDEIIAKREDPNHVSTISNISAGFTSAIKKEIGREFIKDYKEKDKEITTDSDIKAIPEVALVEETATVASVPESTLKVYANFGDYRKDHPKVVVAPAVKYTVDSRSNVVAASVTEPETTVTDLLDILAERAMHIQDQKETLKEAMAKLEEEEVKVANTMEVVRSLRKDK